MKTAKTERLGRELDKITQRSIKNRCRDKIQHDNFLSAMQHAVRLKSLEPNACFSAYHCEDCGFCHVGHMVGTLNYMMESECFNAAELQKVRA